MDTTFSCFLLFEQIESNMAKDRQIFGSLIFADPTVIFMQSHIQDPVQIIFDGPVFAHNVEKAFAHSRQTGDVEAHRLGFLAVDDPCANDHGNAFAAQSNFRRPRIRLR